MAGFSGIEFSFSVMYSSKRWAVVGVFSASILILRCLVLFFVLLEEILQRRRALTRLWSESTRKVPAVPEHMVDLVLSGSSR